MSNEKATGILLKLKFFIKYIMLDCFDKKSENSENVSKLQSDKDLPIYFLLNENRELKENNLKLLEKKEELERKAKLLNLKLDDDESFNIRESIYNKEIQIGELKEKLRLLEIESQMGVGKIGILEGVLRNELKIEDIFKTMPEKEILKYFNDMIIKNIDKREEFKNQNKVLLENLIILGKEYNRKKYFKEN